MSQGWASFESAAQNPTPQRNTHPWALAARNPIGMHGDLLNRNHPLHTFVRKFGLFGMLTQIEELILPTSHGVTGGFSGKLNGLQKGRHTSLASLPQLMGSSVGALAIAPEPGLCSPWGGRRAQALVSLEPKRGIVFAIPQEIWVWVTELLHTIW